MDKELHEAMQRIARHCQTHICDEDCEFHDGRPGHTQCSLAEAPCAWSFTAKRDSFGTCRTGVRIDLTDDKTTPASVVGAYKPREDKDIDFTMTGYAQGVEALLIEMLAWSTYYTRYSISVIAELLGARLKGIKEEMQ